MANKATVKVSKAERELAGAADELKQLKRELAKREAAIIPLKSKIEGCESRLLARMLKSKTESVRGKVGLAYIHRVLVPQIEDERKLNVYVIKNKALDLYQRRINTQAWRDRIDSGEVVPGVKGFQKITVRIR